MKTTEKLTFSFDLIEFIREYINDIEICNHHAESNTKS